MVNRSLGAGPEDKSLRDALKVLTHTYVYATDAQGNLLITYSWGNKFEAAVPNHWYKDMDNDKKAANDAIANQKLGVGPQSVLQRGVTQYDLSTAFEFLDLYPEGGSGHPWVLMATCKEESAKLIALARLVDDHAAARAPNAPNDDIDYLKGYMASHVWVVGGFVLRTSALAQSFLSMLNRDEKTVEAWIKQTNSQIQNGAIKVSNEIQQGFQYVVKGLGG